MDFTGVWSRQGWEWKVRMEQERNSQEVMNFSSSARALLVFSIPSFQKTALGWGRGVISNRESLQAFSWNWGILCAGRTTQIRRLDFFFFFSLSVREQSKKTRLGIKAEGIPGLPEPRAEQSQQQTPAPIRNSHLRLNLLELPVPNSFSWM